MTIICGTDFSENSLKACQVAGALAKKLESSLILVHAIGEFAEFKIQDKGAKSFFDYFNQPLREIAKKLENHWKISVQEKLAAGSPDEILVELAAQSDAQWIIVSHLGRRGPSRWLLGSVAERTAKSSSVPVLVVHSEKPFIEWMQGLRPLRILVGVDLSLASDHALQSTTDWLKLGPCEVTVCYVSKSADVELRKQEEETLRTKAQKLSTLSEVVKVKVLYEHENVGLKLTQMAEQEGMDLIILGRHPRSGWSRFWHHSVSNFVLHNAQLNIACIPTSFHPSAQQKSIPKIKNVVAATDLSSLANQALIYAYSITPPGGTVHLVYVAELGEDIHSIHGFEVGGGKASSDEMNQRVEEIQSILLGLVPQEAEAMGIKTKVHIVKGHQLAKGICETAERLQADVICIGTHGRTGLAQSLLGSVAQMVLQKSSVPVLLWHHPL